MIYHDVINNAQFLLSRKEGITKNKGASDDERTSEWRTALEIKAS